MSSASKKKTRQYSEEYLKFGFIPTVQDERSPFCLLCQQFLSNESMKRGRLEAHLKAKHSAHINSDLSDFKTSKENFEERTTIKSLFTAHTSTNNRVLEASYQISLFIAKTGKTQTIEENLIKPSISAFLKTVLEKDIKAMPLSKNTVSRRIDETGEDIEKQLVEKLKTRKFSVQMDEPTFRDIALALKKCEVPDTALLVIVNHLNNLSANFKERFLDLKQIHFPTWMMQPMLVDLSDISTMQYQAELAELQNDDLVKTLFSIKSVMAWLCEETEIKYPNSSKCARKLLLPFPSSFLAECGFSAVNDLLIKKKKSSAG
ncbi:SCAN domain-containing protein 3 [Trichonephila clavipes]|nr:SCAN domain-containing protein 3 [Trichonephila clavipes]